MSHKKSNYSFTDIIDFINTQDSDSETESAEANKKSTLNAIQEEEDKKKEITEFMQNFRLKNTDDPHYFKRFFNTLDRKFEGTLDDEGNYQEGILYFISGKKREFFCLWKN